MEQRVCGWLSTIEQALDLTGTERIHIANCSSIIATLLSITKDTKYTNKHYEDLIHRMAPQLLKYPINPQDSLKNRIGKRIHREWKSFFTNSDKKDYFKNRIEKLRKRLT